MSCISQIKTALTGITSGDQAVPVALIRYTGSSKKFITYFTISTTGAAFADDDTTETHTRVTVDIFTDGSYTGLLAQVKSRMKAAGFDWLEDGPDLYETDTGLYHKPVNFLFEGE